VSNVPRELGLVPQVEWHANALSLPPAVGTLDQLAYPLNDVNICKRLVIITYLSRNIGCEYVVRL
jgi:hypothetical protein